MEEEKKDFDEEKDVFEKQTKRELFFEILRFLIVGGTATVVDYAVWWIFRTVLFNALGDNLSQVVATALGFMVGLVINWLLSVSFVFRAVKDKAESRSEKSFLLFAAIGVIGLIITEIGMHFLPNWIPSFELFGKTEFLGKKWTEWLSKVIMTTLVLIWNYIGRKLFVFKS